MLSRNSASASTDTFAVLVSSLLATDTLYAPASPTCVGTESVSTVVSPPASVRSVDAPPMSGVVDSDTVCVSWTLSRFSTVNSTSILLPSSGSFASSTSTANPGCSSTVRSALSAELSLATVTLYSPASPLLVGTVSVLVVDSFAPRVTVVVLLPMSGPVDSVTCCVSCVSPMFSTATSTWISSPTTGVFVFSTSTEKLVTVRFDGRSSSATWMSSSVFWIEGSNPSTWSDIVTLVLAPVPASDSVSISAMTVRLAPGKTFSPSAARKNSTGPLSVALPLPSRISLSLSGPWFPWLFSAVSKNPTNCATDGSSTTISMLSYPLIPFVAP